MTIDGIQYSVNFVITGEHKERAGLTLLKKLNTDPANNYVEVRNKVDDGPIKGVSYMTKSGNEGVFQKSNVENVGSSTEAHEFGHSLGLWPGTIDGHPKGNLIGKGQPGIMYPRGTKVDPQYRYNPNANSSQSGGTLNPDKRKVLQSDIDMLHLEKLNYDKNGRSPRIQKASANLVVLFQKAFSWCPKV